RLQAWLKEGLSLECHTIDHPCPLLQGSDFAKAKSTYDRCVDLLHKVPAPSPLPLSPGPEEKGTRESPRPSGERGRGEGAANRPVAFRVPCCDSLNTPSPRFFAEIFNKTTADGNFLAIDSSVMNVIT